MYRIRAVFVSCCVSCCEGESRLCIRRPTDAIINMIGGSKTRIKRSKIVFEAQFSTGWCDT
jgi:hypothetical protein